MRLKKWLRMIVTVPLVLVVAVVLCSDDIVQRPGGALESGYIQQIAIICFFVVLAYSRTLWKVADGNRVALVIYLIATGAALYFTRAGNLPVVQDLQTVWQVALGFLIPLILVALFQTALEKPQSVTQLGIPVPSSEPGTLKTSPSWKEVLEKQQEDERNRRKLAELAQHNASSADNGNY